MGYKVEPYKGKNTVTVGRKNDPDPKVQNARWWTLKDENQLAESLFGVVKYLKENQGWRQHQAALFARLYGNLPVWNYLGINLSKLNAQYRFPSDRPTMNVIQSCTDALIARMVQSKPKPMFITSGGDAKKRKLAKQLNQFIDGEFYACDAYEMGEQALRDATILGTGGLKVYETDDHKVGVERKLCTELFVDESDGMYGFPQQMHELALTDRDVLAGMFPDNRGAIMACEAAYFDSTSDNRNTISSQLMVVESFKLPSCKGADDGKHVIAIGNSILFQERYTKDYFPYVFYKYAPRTLGFWAQGLAEQLMGVQNEINKLLYTIQQSLHICGIPKWMVESSSKVVSAHINNLIGGIIKYTGIKPELAVGEVLPMELYAQLERLVKYAYQQSGISMLAAASQKPAGLDSGAALREYDDLQSDRFAFLSQRYERFYLDLANQIFDKAKDIAERDGKYETIYPGKDAIERVDFPKIDKLKEDEFIIQAFPISALSKNPAERKQEIIDLMQAGLIDPQEGRRLLDYPDLQQVQRLLNAPEERILSVLDAIIEDGEYNPPDPFMDLQKANTLSLQYYNKYVDELSPKRAQMLRDFQTQLKAMVASAAPPAMPAGQPQAQPMPTPTSPMVPNVAV